jgi:hypothetical protein
VSGLADNEIQGVQELTPEQEVRIETLAQRLVALGDRVLALLEDETLPPRILIMRKRFCREEAASIRAEIEALDRENEATT